MLKACQYGQIATNSVFTSVVTWFGNQSLGQLTKASNAARKATATLWRSPVAGTSGDLSTSCRRQTAGRGHSPPCRKGSSSGRRLVESSETLKNKTRHKIWPRRNLRNLKTPPFPSKITCLQATRTEV
eukprot:s4281_g4.t1